MLSYGPAFWPAFWAIIVGGGALTAAVLTLASVAIRRRRPAPAIAVPAEADAAASPDGNLPVAA